MASQACSTHPHCFDRSELVEFTLGKLPALKLERIAAEVETCPRCQALLETLDGLEDSVITDLKGHTGPLPPDPQLQEQIQAAEEISRVVWGDVRASVPDEPPPARLGQYEILEQIGRGGMGTVYKAVHIRLKRAVAIKVLPTCRLQDPQAVARFQREMEAVGQLDHPNLVRAHDAGEAEGQHFLVMEFLDGIDLARLVRRHGPLVMADACEVVRQAAVGLQYAHEHGLVHRDVKPSNTMVATAGQVKVLDLGLARLIAETAPGNDMTATGQIVGTGDFIAPEQGQDPRQADARSDIYSLGCTLYFLLAGRAPFFDPQYDTFVKKVMAHANKPVPSIQAIRTDIPDGLAAVLDRMLAKEPSKRFQTMAEVADALKPYTAGHALSSVLDGQGAVQVQKAGLGAKQRRRGLWLAVMLPLAVIVAVAALGYLDGDVALMVLRGEGLLVVTGQCDDVELVAAPANGPDVKLELDEAGKVRLRAGEYDIHVAGGKTSVVIEPERVTIVRGGRAVVELRRQAGVGTTAALPAIPNLAVASARTKASANIPGSSDAQAATGSADTVNLQQLPAGVTHLWNFEESSGTTVVDVVGGHATNGTIVGGTLTRVPGKVGQALSFSGSSGGYVSIGSGIFPDHPSALTYSVWYYPDPRRPLPGNYLMETTPRSTIYAINGHRKYHGIPHNITPGFGRIALASPASRATQWNLLTVTYDSSLPSAQMATVYVNGSQVGNMPAGAINSLTRTTGLNIGASRSGQDRFVGLIGEVAFWNRALTPLEVQNLYDGGVGARAKASPQAKADPAREALEKGKAVQAQATLETNILGSLVGTQFSTIQEAIRQGAIEETGLIGIQSDKSFREISDDGGLLVGFNVKTGPHGMSYQLTKVDAIQPKFLTSTGFRCGKWYGGGEKPPTQSTVQAKDGYAVGGIQVAAQKGEHHVSGMRIIFMKIKNGSLDVQDKYSSPWYGMSGAESTPIGGANGKFVIGVKGSYDHKLVRGIGLVLLR